MEERSIIERVEFKKGEQQELKRNKALLKAVFGADFISISVEKMPEEFELPQEMVKIFKEIMDKEDYSEVEYAVAGNVKDGKLFFGKIARGKEDAARLPMKDHFLSFIGLRGIVVHSHGKLEDDVRMSAEDIAHFLLVSTIGVEVVMTIKEKFPQEYRIFLGIRGEEGFVRERERYLAGKYAQLAPHRQLYSYLSRKLRETEVKRPLNEVAAIFRHNGCALYVGTGHIDSESLRVMKVHPFDFTKFEEDPQTKLMLPKE